MIHLNFLIYKKHKKTLRRSSFINIILLNVYREKECVMLYYYSLFVIEDDLSYKLHTYKIPFVHLQ